MVRDAADNPTTDYAQFRYARDAYQGLATESSRYHTDGRFPSQLLRDTSRVPDMDLLDLYEYAHWARSVRGLADNTIRVRLDLLTRLHTYLGIPLRDAEPGHLLKFEKMAIAGRSPETRRAYVCHIRAFYRWAMRVGIVTEDPSQMLTIPKVPRHLPRPIEEDDLTLALTAARPKLRAILTLAAYAGLRAVEISGLEWQDFRREPDGTAYLVVRKGKGGKQRAVQVGDTVIRALQAYGIKRRGPMFLGLEGGPMDPRSVSSSANRHLAKYGVEATLHQLRHRYGTVAYQLSRDLRMVQEQLGHASAATTQIYTRPSAEAATRMVAAMDALASPTPRPDHDPAGARSA